MIPILFWLQLTIGVRLHETHTDEKHCPAPLVSPRLRDPFTRTPNLDFLCVCVREALERLALLHRFPLLFLPLAGVVLTNSSINIALHDTFCPFSLCCKYGCRLYDNGSQPETTSHCIYRVAVEVEPLKIHSPSPLRHHQSPHVCSHILRGERSSFLLPSAFPEWVGYSGLGNRPQHRRI